MGERACHPLKLALFEPLVAIASRVLDEVDAQILIIVVRLDFADYREVPAAEVVLGVYDGAGD